MRDIKFRCWDTENKQMLKVQELDFEDTFYGGRLSIRADMYNDYFDIEDMILMQYTGLKDKKQKEIYEGDILVYIEDGSIGKVTWNKEEAGFYFSMLLEDGGYEEEMLSDYINNLEVIGNIYDNPELLEEGE